MKTPAYALALLMTAAAALGCIPSHEMGAGEMDRWWALTDNPARGAVRPRPGLGDSAMPTRWIIRQKPSVILSTVSIVRAYDRLKEGADEIDLSVSPTHTDTLAHLLAEARGMLGKLRRLADAGGRPDRSQWARTMAAALARIEYIARRASVDATQEAADQAGEPAGFAAGPVLEMLVGYLNERSGGALLKDFAPEEVDRIRSLLTQMVLRLGFDMAGRQVPAGLRDASVKVMRQARRFDALEAALAELLTGQVEQAPRVPGESKAKEVIAAVLKWAPKAMEFLEAFLRQWDRIDRIEVELLRRGGESMVAVTVRVRPGKEVRLEDVVIFQPSLIFRGSSRVVVVPEAPGTGETVVLFEPIDGGAVELRFEGLVYGLLRVFAFPLASGALREIRVFSGGRQGGPQIVSFTMAMEARGDRTDPRRLLTFQDVRTRRLVRDAFSVRSVTTGEAQVFNYLTPLRRYTYRRAKEGP